MSDIPQDIQDLLREARDCLHTADAVNNQWLEEICERIDNALDERTA